MLSYFDKNAGIHEGGGKAPATVRKRREKVIQVTESSKRRAANSTRAHNTHTEQACLPASFSFVISF